MHDRPRALAERSLIDVGLVLLFLVLPHSLSGDAYVRFQALSELIEQFEREIGRKTIGNKPASGTEIIKELGEEHMRTEFPIVYTSGDSVFQIAMHEAVIPIARQYEICETARKILVGEHEVGRVICRPFEGVASSGLHALLGNPDAVPIDHLPALPAGEKQNHDHEKREDQPRRDDGLLAVLIA